MLSVEDTICAVASAAGGAVRGVVRISGPNTCDILQRCFEPAIEARYPSAIPGRLCLDQSSRQLPVELFLWPNQQSYTRQPTAELHTFGSPPLLAAVVRTLCSHGARPAEAGEFTLRAFLAGRLDLVQAEAVLGVIDAAGRKPLEAALKQLAGGVSKPLTELRESLLNLLAHVEAGLDFVEEDISFIAQSELSETLAFARESVETLITQLSARATANELPRVVLLGLPNVGKSSLFNALVGRSSSIVANHPSTTRDYLTAIVEFDGMKCELVDTAGVEHDSPIASLEQSAQQASADLHATAQLTLLCLDSTRLLEPIEAAWHSLQNSCAESTTVTILTKCDLPKKCGFQDFGIETSSSTGRGISELAGAIRRAMTEANADHVVTGTAERCDESLRSTAKALSLAFELSQGQGAEELIAAELRVALNELGRVVGAIYTDDILDRIFSRFCIGK